MALSSAVRSEARSVLAHLFNRHVNRPLAEYTCPEKGEYLETVARFISKDELAAMNKPLRSGKLDPVTGQIVWEDGEREVVQLPPPPKRRPRAAATHIPVEAKPAKPPKVQTPPRPRRNPKPPKPKPGPRVAWIKLSPEKDPRYEQVLQMRRAGHTATEIAKGLHMAKRIVSQYLRGAGIVVKSSRTGGTPKRGKPQITRDSLLALLIEHGSAGKLAKALGNVSTGWVMVWVRKFGLPEGQTGRPYRMVLKEAGLIPEEGSGDGC